MKHSDSYVKKIEDQLFPLAVKHKQLEKLYIRQNKALEETCDLLDTMIEKYESLTTVNTLNLSKT